MSKDTEKEYKKYVDLREGDVEKKLKSCPFCGTKPYAGTIFVNTGEDEVNLCVIVCPICKIELSELWYFDDIIERWNSRHEQR